jgi:hypothetical protein
MAESWAHLFIETYHAVKRLGAQLITPHGRSMSVRDGGLGTVKREFGK